MFLPNVSDDLTDEKEGDYEYLNYPVLGLVVHAPNICRGQKQTLTQQSFYDKLQKKIEPG